MKIKTLTASARERRQDAVLVLCVEPCCYGNADAAFSLGVTGEEGGASLTVTAPWIKSTTFFVNNLNITFNNLVFFFCKKIQELKKK